MAAAAADDERAGQRKSIGRKRARGNHTSSSKLEASGSGYFSTGATSLMLGKSMLNASTFLVTTAAVGGVSSLLDAHMAAELDVSTRHLRTDKFQQIVHEPDALSSLEAGAQR